ncbi:HipA domain-containing protein [Rheinheimera sp.]|uniref:HipA domain-containing protein n=1 Tax=Rheinheimera sp. TaxID=1869214 RepID=UPI002627F263|nr:HipA domain-containing protein [Rheinheimera sp.]MCA1931294.1 HipA domain-containing protein [Rheinheimera sp.]
MSQHIEVIDVTDWLVDDTHGIFPIGARDKQMLWSPAETIPAIKPNWPYLFKCSRPAYPDQFWMECIAYLIGTELGFDVPKALPAKSLDFEGKVVCAALIEWFYDPQTQNFVHAADFFQQIFPDFDHQKGSQHNLLDLIKICRVLSKFIGEEQSWNQWLNELILFDSIIGNTDRHQENWGIVHSPNKKPSIKLSPLFDNGTSLGHERFPANVSRWNDAKVDKYIKQGAHHLRIDAGDPKVRLNHLESVRMLVNESEQNKAFVQQVMQTDFATMLAKLEYLCEIELEIPLSKQRFDWISRLLLCRHKLICELLTS